MLRRLAECLLRFIVALQVLINYKKEPFLKMTTLVQYVLFGNYYPDKVYVSIEDEMLVTKEKEFLKLQFRGDSIYYDKVWPIEKVKKNFHAIFNEQTPDSPHVYLTTNQIESDWIIYDLGPAEGYQSKLWSKKAKHIYLFEPDIDFYTSLLKTFEQEIENKKVTVINLGVSNENKDLNIGNKMFKLRTLDSIIKDQGLLLPDYIKVDIEGEEMKLLTSSVNILKSENLKVLQITVYHRPNDYIEINAFLQPYFNHFKFNDGVVFFNRDGLISGNYLKVYHPLIRKSLLTCSRIHV